MGAGCCTSRSVGGDPRSRIAHRCQARCVRVLTVSRPGTPPRRTPPRVPPTTSRSPLSPSPYVGRAAPRRPPPPPRGPPRPHKARTLTSLRQPHVCFSADARLPHKKLIDRIGAATRRYGVIYHSSYIAIAVAFIDEHGNFNMYVGFPFPNASRSRRAPRAAFRAPSLRLDLPPAGKF